MSRLMICSALSSLLALGAVAPAFAGDDSETALGGAMLMDETLGLRLLVSALAILGGIFCATALPHLLRRT